jgi:hypothetical protein
VGLVTWNGQSANGVPQFDLVNVKQQPLPTRARTIKVKFAALSSSQPGMTRVAVEFIVVLAVPRRFHHASP